MERNKGWFNHSPEHALGSKGLSTKRNVPRTETKTPGKTTNKTTTGNTLTKEFERIYILFADYNFRYTLSSSFDNNGIYLSPADAMEITKNALPNGCGNFSYRQIEQLSEVYEKNVKFMIRRDDDGAVLLLVKGIPKVHPGQIREWLGADISTIDENDVITYKWSPSTSATEENKLLRWSAEVQSGNTDLGYDEWSKKG